MLHFLFGLLLLALCMQGDLFISKFCIPLQTSTFVPPLLFLEKIFSFGVISSCWGLTFLYQWVRKKKISKELLEICASFFILFFLTYFLKWGVGRTRPFSAILEQTALFHPFAGTDKFFSFPSSHALAAFVSATGLSHLYPRKKAGLFFIAFIISTLRVISLHHFLSDVLFGSYLGFIVTKDLLKKNGQGESLSATG